MSVQIVISIFLGVFSSILQILGYLEYSKKVFRKIIRPNIASWAIWAFAAILESASYIVLTRDLIKNLLPFFCAISAIIFFIYTIRQGHFSKPTFFDLWIIIIDIIILIIWFISKSPFLANVLFIISAVISFVPIIINSYKNPKDENAYPWIIWSIAYFIMAITVILRWEKWEDLIYPFTFFVLHVIIGYLSLDSRTVEETK